MVFGLQRAKVLGYVSVQFISKISNVWGPESWSTNVTDGRADTGV